MGRIGQIAWNKGLKGIHLSPKTEFKKGSVSWNEGKGVGNPVCNDCGARCYAYSNRCRKCYVEFEIKIKENHPRWKKDRGLVKLDKERGGPLHKQWSRDVKNRDGWKCKISNGDCSGRLESHHILNWSNHIELRYEINNGITLCHFHHPRKRDDENRLSPYFQSLVGKVN